MKKSAGRRLAAFGLTAALAISAITVPGEASAAKAVKKVTVNKKKVTLYPKADANYGSIKIKATIKPKGAKAKLKWKSSKKKVATVNSKGLIKAKKAGKATITVKAGKKSAKVKVTVKKIKKKVSKVTVANNSLTLNKNQTASIKASVAPKKATLKKLSYKSANTKVASVTTKGVVKGLQAGSTTITVRAVDGSKKQAKVTVKVVEPTKPVVNPTKAPVVVPSVAPSTKPSTAPTSEPSTKPTSEPSTKPTSKPSTEPTSEPTTEPTSEPTTAPTSEPTTEPTSKPTTEPTSEPTTAPTSGPVEPTADPDIPGNVKYTLDAEKEYEAKVTVLGKEIDLNTTDATVDTADKALSKALNGMTEFYKDKETYMNKVIAPTTYTVADGATVTVSKDKLDNAWDYGLKLKLSGVSGDFDGDYSTMVNEDGDGQYTITPNAKYYVEGQDWGKGNTFIFRFAESALVTDAQGTQTMTYDIDELSLKVGKDEKKLATKGDVSDNIKATVTKTADGAETVTVVGKGKTIVIKKDASGYSYSIPKEYQEKYGIQLGMK